jgi:putative hemolysin
VAYVELLFLFWLIAVLTAMEMATFSARRERMVQATESGDRRGRLVNAFQRSPAEYISAIQLLATAANFVVGAMIAANVERPVSRKFEEWIPGFEYRSQLSWFVSVGLVTILALIFTNVLPKHIGFVRANEIALRTAPLMRFWIKASWPITLFVRRTTKALARMLRVAPDEKFRVTERDIDQLLMEGLRAGSLDPTEQAVMRRALKLSDLKVKTAMVPREQVLWIDADWPPQRIEEFLRRNERSNYLVADGRLDKPSGVLRALDWFFERDLRRAMQPMVTAGSNDSLLIALEKLRPAGTRLLVVRDGGRVEGVLTLNDALGALVGPIRQT